MPDFTLTESQKNAVYERGRDMLVSAAAGSGKTSVLAQRLTALVEEGADIRRMLVVTFTDAAAAEMRSRIVKELETRAEAVGDARLHREAELVSAADICTIHRFSIKVIRENFAFLGVAADIRAAGNEECAVLRARAMEQVFEAFYEAEDESFLTLRDRYSGRTDRELARILLEIYNFAESRPEGVDWVRNAGCMDIDAYMAVASERIQSRLEKLAGLMESCRKMAEEFSLPPKQVDNNETDLRMARGLLQAFAAGGEEYEKTLECCNIPAIARGIAPVECKEALSEAKKEGRKILKELREVLPSHTRRQIEEEIPYMIGLSQALFRTISAFQDCYLVHKAENRVMDYDDMIRLAYRALSEEEIAAAYSGRYDYVFIDEYQDTNPIQEALLSRIVPRGGRFIVGDMKQSVYRFRLADPLIFLNRAEAYACDPGKILIHMNENFRSAPAVIDGVNYIMRRLMSPKLGELTYGEGEALRAGRDIPGGVEVLLTDPSGMEHEKDPTVKEFHSIARRILLLLAEKGEGGNPKYGPGDICVLLRNMEGNAKVLERILQSYGIDARAPAGQPAAGPGVEVFVNLLKVVDGFSSDIALLSVMRSHIGGFDEAELAAIRRSSKEGSFSSCLFAYEKGEGPGAEKCQAFLQKMRFYRELARSLLTEDLLLLLKNETEYMASLSALPGGKEKARQFSDFFEKCLAFAREQEGLYALLSRLEAVKRETGTYGGSKDSESQGFVRIMSIHRSKGLEFPVVLLARTGTRFSGRDLNKSILLHPLLGLASDRIDEKRRTISPSLAKDMLRYVLDKEMKSEELRLLYVAMTRAKEKLILSGVVREPEQFFPSFAGKTQWYELLSMRCMLEWLVSGVLDLPCMADWLGKEQRKEGLQIAHRVEMAFAGRAQEMAPRDIREVLLEAGKLPYQPFLHYQKPRVPVKIGVSALLPEDELGGDIPAYTARKDTGAKLGSLIHLFMQHVDLAVDSTEDIENAAAAMEKKLLLGASEKRRILAFAPEILEFLRSDIAKRARASARLLREVPFSLAVPAREIGVANSEEKVMLQGIIDMVFEERDGLVLVDYKSNMADADRLETLGKRYSLQIKLYEKALLAITGRPVKESYLWFLRARNKFRVF